MKRIGILLVACLFCLVPALVFADIVVYKGSIKSVGFQYADLPDQPVEQGYYQKANEKLYLVADVDTNTGAILEAYLIWYDKDDGVILPAYNLELVYDETMAMGGIFSADLFDEGSVTNGSRIITTGRMGYVDIGSTVIPLPKSIKGSAIDRYTFALAEYKVGLRADTRTSKTANLDYGGDIGLTIDSIVSFLMSRGVVFAGP